MIPTIFTALFAMPRVREALSDLRIDHKKNSNCEDKPLCLYAHNGLFDAPRHNMGERNLYAILEELEKVRDVATSMMRDDSKPMGLINAHNTCYLNVLLQCLYRLVPFRELLFRFAIRITRRMGAKCSDKTSILYALQKLFAVMSLSKSLSYYPEELMKSMSINPDVQCDVHEFFDTLLTAVKSSLISQQQADIAVVLAVSLHQQKSIDSLFSGKRLLCRCCLTCHRVFYRPDMFSFLVATVAFSHT